MSRKTKIKFTALGATLVSMFGLCAMERHCPMYDLQNLTADQNLARDLALRKDDKGAREVSTRALHDHYSRQIEREQHLQSKGKDPEKHGFDSREHLDAVAYHVQMRTLTDPKNR